MLLGLTIQNYLLFDEVTVGLNLKRLTASEPTELATAFEALPSLTSLSAVIGRNHTGKTTFFQAVEFISDCLKFDVQYASTLRNKDGLAKLLYSKNITQMSFACLLNLEAESYLHYEFAVDFDRYSRPFICFEKVIKAEVVNGKWQQVVLLQVENTQGFVWDENTQQNLKISLLEKKMLALSIYGRIFQYRSLCLLRNQIVRWFFLDLNDHEIQMNELGEFGGHKHLNRYGNNIPNVLQYLKLNSEDQYKQIMENIKMQIPEAQYIGDNFLDGGLQSGNLKLFTYLLLLADPRPRPLIILNKPDNGLYHDMVDALMMNIRDYTVQNPRHQVLLSTHNPYVLDRLIPEEVWIMQKTEKEIKASCIGDNLLVKKMYEEGIGMGSMWYSGYFDDGGMQYEAYED